MNICILGAGAYGLCLGITTNKNGFKTTIWTKFEDEKNSITNTRKIPALPNIKIDENIIVTTNLELAIKNSNLIVIALPAGTVRDVLTDAKEYIDSNKVICIATKGIEQNTFKFMSDVVKEIIDTDKISVISGPTFAIDVAIGAPVELSLASQNETAINLTKKALQNEHTKLIETNDLIGVQFCGSIKNVMAIASGIISGMNYPISTQVMFITEAINDIKNLIINLGGKENTISAPAGIGDIILTCTSVKSRNYTFGTMIGSKYSKDEINSFIKNNNVEGLYTLNSISNLLKLKKISMPIIDILTGIIYNEKPASDLLKFLLTKV